MAADIFRHTHRVSYAECTLGNHIYYARYLDLLEEARGELFRHLGAPLLQWQNADTIFPVVECLVRYKAPARYDDVLTIEVWLTEAAGVRLNFAYRVVDQNGRLIVEAQTRHVCTSIGEKPRRVPEPLQQALLPHLKASPDQPG